MRSCSACIKISIIRESYIISMISRISTSAIIGETLPGVLPLIISIL